MPWPKGKPRSADERQRISTAHKRRLAHLTPAEHRHRMRHAVAGRRRWIAANPQRASEIGRRAGRLGGAARARQCPVGYGRQCHWNGILCASIAEARVLAMLMHADPDCVVERWHGEPLEYAKEDGSIGQWSPDLRVTHLSGETRVIEVKYAPRAPTRPQAADIRGRTTNHIIAKMQAHPQVELWNGASRDIVARFDCLVEQGVFPPIKFMPE